MFLTAEAVVTDKSEENAGDADMPDMGGMM